MDDPTTGAPFYPSASKPAGPALDGLDASAEMFLNPADSPRVDAPRAADHDYQPLCDSLSHIVASSDPARFAGAQPDQLAPSEIRKEAVHAATPTIADKSWLKHFFPSAETVDRLFAREHMGNFVVDRQTGRKVFESMPLYVRVGMHLLFVSASQAVAYRAVEQLLITQSLKQGEQYDATGPGVLPHIQAFINAYAIPLDELLEPDLTKYPTFNHFFARRLKADARPVACPDDQSVVVCPADCRLSVFATVEAAKTLWIKGRKFTISCLLYGDDKDDHQFDSVARSPASVAVARLAPQDYHRFHSPVDGEIVCVKDIAGELYTVNPQAVNEDLNVFTLNKRSVMLIHADMGLSARVPMAFVAVGAMLVGSICWSKKPGDRVRKGEELGWFQYGGSTCILVVPQSSGLKFDEDLLRTSQKGMETLVQVGTSMGHVGRPRGVQEAEWEV
ncbi:hypothetical protein CC85DRAFT_284571 [Cutaneotrichosporon oleaginosum]|uniref:phosphatidylserine decarboxylase n=1 Tax=Cutaneotrichosporon oleaginosum TaxID=879819 RepID=A0A0J0XQS6_9TREE|nr:uncharacterized protein CC85DRAFT_284571 [Cutaneotrichosporon oleaginosum]KLT43430.1 hypothetical protein CC85DRAFT_284571 [Cutaneotrichosporon oleaginosum]TXT05357.1 hypothetical protein COLE_06677 [Cutaneotrichosporon oleaginosum]